MKTSNGKEPGKTVFSSGNVRTAVLSDAENALKVLGNIYVKLPDINEAEIKLFVTTVHGMKSGLANLGEEELSAFALKLEKAGDERDFAVISEEIPVFIAELQSLIAKFYPEESYNAEISDDAIIPEDSRIYLQEKLLEIKTACAAFNKNAVKAALEELNNKTWPARINNVLDDLAIHLLHSTFKKAAVLAEDTANKLK